MKTPKIARRMLAAAMAIATSVCSLSAIPASAVAPNSKIEYFLYVQNKGSNKVSLNVEFTKNPGMDSMTFMVYYDSDCTYTGYTSNIPNALAGPVPNAQENTICFTVLTIDTVTDLFSFTLDFNTSDSANNSHQFSTGIRSFDSTNNSADIVSEDDEIVIDTVANTSTPYYLGDMDNNATISLQDAQSILTLSNYTGGSSVSVNYVNSNLSAIKNKYPKLVCGEVADVNFDRKITQSDATDVQWYYANAAAGSVDEDSLIGTRYYKVIYS